MTPGSKITHSNCKFNNLTANILRDRNNYMKLLQKQKKNRNKQTNNTKESCSLESLSNTNHYVTCNAGKDVLNLLFCYPSRRLKNCSSNSV